MESLLIAINCVIPAFFCLCLGALIRRSGTVPEQTFSHISSMAFHFLLPCTIFHSIYSTDLSTSFDPRLLGYLVGFILIWYAVGFALSRLFVPNHRTRGAFIQIFFRSNIAIIGVSMADAMMGSSGVASMSMAIAVLVPLFNILAVVTLEVCRGGTVRLRPTLAEIAKNPMLQAAALGLVFLLADISIPTSILKAINQIGSAGSVMTLVALGAAFRLDGVKENWKKVVLGNVIRLVIAPMAAVTAALLLGFRGNDLGVILLCTAPSLASSSYPMAMARDSDYELTGQVVVTSSFFCCITLFLWIFCLKLLGLL